MSFLMGVSPEALKDLAARLMAYPAALKDVSAQTSPVTTGVEAPGWDDVSELAAMHLARHAKTCYEKLSRASNTLERYAANLELAAAAYSSTEDDNAKAVQST